MKFKILDVVFLKNILAAKKNTKLTIINKNFVLIFRLYALFYYKHYFLPRTRIFKKYKKYKNILFLFLWGLQQKVNVSQPTKKFVDILYNYYMSSFYFFIKVF